MLTLFTTGTPKIVSVITQNSSGKQIDISKTTISFSYSTANTKYSVFEFSAAPDSQLKDNPQPGYWVGGAGSGRYLFWTFSSAQAWDITTVINIYSPLTIMGNSFTQLYIAQDSTTYDFYGATQAISEDVITQSVSQSIVVYKSRITVSIVNPPNTLFYTMVASGSGQTAYPIAASNLGTFYECWAKGTTTTPTPDVIQIGSWPFSVTMIEASSNDIYTKPMCLSNIPGIPIVAYFTALQINMDFEATDFVYEITFTGMTDLGTGLPLGSNLPFYSPESADASITLTSDGTNVVLKITDLGSFNINDVATLYIPKGITENTYEVTNRLYYTTSTDPTLIYEVYYNTETVLYDSGTEFTTATTETSYDLEVNTNFDMSFSLQTTLANVNKYVGIVIPQGFQVSKTTMAVDDEFPDTYIKITSENQLFRAGVIIAAQIDDFQIDNVDSILDLYDLTAALGATGASEDDVAFYAFQSEPDFGESCLGISSSSILGVSLTSSMITESIFSPQSYKLRGPGSVNVNMDINFRTKNLIYVGGSIEITLSSNFGVSSVLTTCVVLEMDPANKDIPVSCVFTGSKMTITNFEELQANYVVTVSVKGLLPPSSGTTTQYVTLIRTFDVSGKIIDLKTSFTSDCQLEEAETIGTSDIRAAVYPNNIGLNKVDLALSFSLNKNVPSRGTIEISNGISGWLFTSGSISDNCWSNIKYSSCQYVGSAIILTLSEDYTAGVTAQVYLDSALNLPSTEGDTSSGFKIVSK